jgi:hypothetical protein
MASAMVGLPIHDETKVFLKGESVHVRLVKLISESRRHPRQFHGMAFFEGLLIKY